MTTPKVSSKINKLYRDTQTITVSDVSLKFLTPGMSQQGLLIEFITGAFAEDNLNNLAKEDFFVECLKKLLEVNESSEEQKTKYVLNLLLWDSNTKHLFRLIKECFPEIENPQLLKLEVLAELLNILLAQYGGGE